MYILAAKESTCRRAGVEQPQVHNLQLFSAQ